MLSLLVMLRLMRLARRVQSLKSHFVAFGLRRLITDDYVHCRFDNPSSPSTDYIKVCLIVDDMLVAVKGKISIEMFDTHVEKRWALKKPPGVDGFLNNNCYWNKALNTMTMCMDVRITEIMKEHLPLEMGLDAKAFPPTPNHPELMRLTLTDPALSPALAKSSHRLGCQLMYGVVMIFFPAQFAVFFAARFSSSPSALYRDCLLYSLRHIYACRHMGLTLGGHGDAGVIVSGMMRSSVAMAVGASADAGHAQAGPSTGGYTLELGTATVHAVSGAHHATTLGTTDSEAYEVSRAVASTVAFRSFMSEFGFPQARPAEVKNDNSGTIAKAASDASDKRSLYMKRRVKFIQECQAAGEVIVVYVQSALNRADILTKPVTAKVYAGLRDAILNIRCAAVNIHAVVAAKMAF